jgi:hypothetical protein
MGTARILALQRGERNDPAHLGERTKVEPIVPSEVEGAAVLGHAGHYELGLDGIERRKAALEPGPVAHDADLVPHAIEQAFAQAVQVPTPAGEWVQCTAEFRLEHGFVGRPVAGIAGDPAGYDVAGDAAEDSRVGDAVATEPVGAVHAARVLTSYEQPGPLGRRIRPADHPAHEIVRGRHDLDQSAGKIETAVAAAIHHPLELLGDLRRSEVAHLDVDPTVRGGAARPHLGVDRTADHVTRRALELVVVVAHEAVHRAVEQMAPCPAQALLQHSAGHARVRAGEQPGRMELHHLHVAQGQARAQRHRQPVHALVARRRVITIHGRPAAGRQQHRLRADKTEFAAAHIGHQHAGKRAILRRNECDRAMLLEAADRARPDLFHQPVDDLDAGEVALVHGAVEALPGEGLAVQRAVRIAIEEAADLVLELLHALDRSRHQRPGEFLMRQPFAALDRIHEMARDRVAGVERHVVATLHHAGATRLAEQALADDRDVKIGVGFVCVQRREKPRPACAEDQDVGLETFEGHALLRTCAPAG